jgi:hypothetical protein
VTGEGFESHREFRGGAGNSISVYQIQPDCQDLLQDPDKSYQHMLEQPKKIRREDPQRHKHRNRGPCHDRILIFPKNMMGRVRQVVDQAQEQSGLRRSGSGEDHHTTGRACVTRSVDGGSGLIPE